VVPLAGVDADPYSRVRRAQTRRSVSLVTNTSWSEEHPANRSLTSGPQFSISGRSVPEDRAAIPSEPSTADPHQPHPVLPDRQPFLGTLMLVAIVAGCEVEPGGAVGQPGVQAVPGAGEAVPYRSVSVLSARTSGRGRRRSPKESSTPSPDIYNEFQAQNTSQCAAAHRRSVPGVGAGLPGAGFYHGWSCRVMAAWHHSLGRASTTTWKRRGSK
jgi:hypothetical protein